MGKSFEGWAGRSMVEMNDEGHEVDTRRGALPGKKLCWWSLLTYVGMCSHDDTIHELLING